MYLTRIIDEPIAIADVVDITELHTEIVTIALRTVAEIDTEIVESLGGLLAGFAIEQVEGSAEAAPCESGQHGCFTAHGNRELSG
jgi:hypothetical protein